MFPTPLVSLDFETTGLAPECGDRVTEVGLARIENGRIVARFASLMNGGVRLTRSTIAYTGITQAMLDAAPAPAAVIPRVLDFIRGCAVVSHNALFDQQFLQSECRRLQLTVAFEPFLCTMRIARSLYPQVPTPSLADLARALSLPSTGRAHRAGADAELTAHLALRMMQDMRRRQIAPLRDEPMLGRLRSWSMPEPAVAL